MDPELALSQAIAGDREARLAYNAWVAKGGYRASVKVWHSRVFGVPVHLDVTKVGTKRLHGSAYAQLVHWETSVPFDAIVN